MRPPVVLLVLVGLVAAPPSALAQATCPGAAGPDAEAGWSAYREGDLSRARGRFAAALALCPGDPYASTGLGYVALREGAREEALRAFRQVVEARPDDLDALVGLGILAWWEGHVAEAGARFRRVLALEPGHSTALEYLPRIQAAQDAAAAQPESSLAAPSVEASLGAGSTLILSGDTRGAVAAFREALAADPDDQGALVGLGRALTWGGRLAEGEATLRRARAADPADVGALVALAQNLRWQGRNPAALTLLQEAHRLAPGDGDVAEQRSWVDAALSPQVRPAVTGEWDSEDNRMVTSALAASLRPVPRLTVRADAYRRSLELGFLERWAEGLTVSAGWEVEPGWSFSGGVGASRSNGSGKHSFGAWSLSLASPRRRALAGAFTASSSALDVTAPLAETGVRVTEAGAAGQWSPGPGWRVEGTAGVASFEGSDANRRTSVSAAAFRRLGRVWTLGGGVRAFGFRDDLADGYFDPDFYGIAELSLRWMHEPGRWSLVADLAPAVQQVTRDGDPTGAVRASARVSFRLAPGREVTLSGGVSSTGLQSFATGASGYRYRALGLGAVWVF
ncbi:MAG TPA: tetratricopeptide repeat protein [Longimicrobiales bacterium]|nr:tetratricopeptide repeat protein [Longimicrobiales bacterium]